MIASLTIVYKHFRAVSPIHDSFFLPDIEGAKVVSRAVSLAVSSLPASLEILLLLQLLHLTLSV